MLMPANAQTLVDAPRANADGPVVIERSTRRLRIDYNASATSKGDNPN